MFQISITPTIAIKFVLAPSSALLTTITVIFHHVDDCKKISIYIIIFISSSDISGGGSIINGSMPFSFIAVVIITIITITSLSQEQDTTMPEDECFGVGSGGLGVGFHVCARQSNTTVRTQLGSRENWRMSFLSLPVRLLFPKH